MNHELLGQALDILDQRIVDLLAKAKDLRCPTTRSRHYRNTGAAVVECATDLLDDCLATLGGTRVESVSTLPPSPDQSGAQS